MTSKWWQRERSTVLAVLLFAAALLFTACGDTGPYGGNAGGEDRESGAVTVAGKQANDHGTATVAGQSSVKVELGEFFFEPTVLRGNPGQTLTIDLQNVGQAAHTFTLSSQDIDKIVQAGQAATAEITLPQSGQVAFVCRFHEEQNMRGGLDVGGAESGEGGGDGGY